MVDVVWVITHNLYYVIVPPDLIKTPLPDWTVKLNDTKSMFRVTPEGMLKTEPPRTSTFPWMIVLELIAQLSLTVQSPEAGGVQDSGGVITITFTVLTTWAVSS